MIEVKEILNKNDWENFVLGQKYNLFVQSYKYGQFYEAMSEKYWLIGIYSDGTLIGGSLVVSVHAKRGRYLYLPYGPIVSEVFWPKIREILNAFTGCLLKISSSEKSHFLKMTPFWVDSEENRGLVKSLGFRPSPLHTTSENTWILDLNKTEEVLLSEMNKNHRNLIRRCIKEGVRVEINEKKESLSDFNKLHDITAKRHNFTRFSEKFIKLEFEAFNQSGEAKVINGYLPDGRIDSSAIIMFYGNMAAYRQGSSLNLDRRLPTSYLVQWTAIQEAKKRGMKWYNFWGVAPDGAKKSHPFYGISHFKKGFGGSQIDLLHCHDLPITYIYWLNWAVETCRKFKRGFA